MTANRWGTSPRPSTSSSTAQWITPAGAGRGGGKRYDSAMARQPHAHALMVVIEPAEGAWRAYCPVLLDYGAAIWGATREEALDHIREVVGMVVARMAEDGASIPLAPGPGSASSCAGGTRTGGGGADRHHGPCAAPRRAEASSSVIGHFRTCRIYCWARSGRPAAPLRAARQPRRSPQKRLVRDVGNCKRQPALRILFRMGPVILSHTRCGRASHTRRTLLW